MNPWVLTWGGARSKSILWINVILGILVVFDTTIDILTNVGHLDLYFSWSSDFALYLECYLMYEHHYLGL